jgi:phosphatidylglycerol:prolipoprotein diacylglycerol transferase
LKWKEKKKAFDGQIFWLLIFLYAMIRFFVEMVRGDPRGSLFYGLLSTSQGIGIFLGILSIFMLFYLRIEQRR